MNSPQPSLTVEQLQSGWTPRRIGRRVTVLAETPSTNDAAFACSGDADADGLAVFADFQTQGRGRQGRTWLAPRGAGLLCSVLLLEPHDTPDLGGRLTLVAAVAACEAIRSATEVTPAIKWPNDLRCHERKLGGILVESRPSPSGKAYVIGLGINCLQHAAHFPPDLRETATSLDLEASHPIDRAPLARELLRRLDHWVGHERPDDAKVHDAWMSYAEPIGRPVRVRRAGVEYTGRILDVDPSAGLVVQCDDGRREWFEPSLTTLL